MILHKTVVLEELIVKVQREKNTLETEFKEFDLGTHFCSIYRNKEEQFATVIPFTRKGLQQNEKCVYVIDKNTKKEVIQAFKDEGIAVDSYMAKGQIQFFTKEETYLRDGYFAPERMIGLLKDLEEQALNKGYEGLRATGEMTWYFTKMPGVEDLIEYEAKLNYFLTGSKSTLLCQYNEQKFSPGILLDVLYTHPKVILYGSLHQNPYYIPPDHFLAKRKGEVHPEVYEQAVEDIRRRTELKRKRKQAREEFQHLFNTIQDAIFVHDLQGELLAVNETAIERLGYSEEELLSMNLQEIDAPAYAKEALKERLRKIEEEKTLTFESAHVTKHEERIPVEMNSSLCD